MMNLGSDLPRPYTRRSVASAPVSRVRPYQQSGEAVERNVCCRPSCRDSSSHDLFPSESLPANCTAQSPLGAPPADAQVFTRRGLKSGDKSGQSGARLPSAFGASSSSQWGEPGVAAPMLSRVNLELRVLGRPKTAASHATGRSPSNSSSGAAFPARMAHGRGPVLMAPARSQLGSSNSRPRVGFALPLR